MSIYRSVLLATMSVAVVLPAEAETFCVSDPTALRNTLVTAAANGQDDLVQIVQGSYLVNLDFTVSPIVNFEGFAITLEGGYLAGCTGRVADPSNTVIDANFDGSVIAFVTPAINGPANFDFDALTLRNGRGKQGAGLNVSTTGDVTINNCVVRDNSTSRPLNGGGVRIIWANRVVFSGNQILNNQANEGGGISVENAGIVSIVGNQIIGNTAGSAGGGLEMQGGCLELLADNTIDGNIADSGGGLIWEFGTSCDSTMSGNSITSNTAQFEGGGIYLQRPAKLIGNTITGNAASIGGGLRVSGVGTKLVNNLIAGNTGDLGAGAALFGSVDFFNNTVTGNNGTETGGVWVRLGNSGPLLNLTNNIIVENTGPVADLQIIDDNQSVANIFNNDFDQASAILGVTTLIMQNNLDGVVPHFVDSMNADYRLNTSSPLINAGTNIPGLPATDLLGNQRIVAGTVDIGAYESPPVPTFADVPADYWSFSFIETLFNTGITAGCGGNNYCPSAPVTRAQMAVFLERGMNGSGYSPPAATGNVFIDVGAGDFAASFIEQLFSDGITAGCGNDNYCPDADVTRDQMAVFLLRAKYGSAYSPPPATGIFNDVPLGHWAFHWIEQLAAEGITAGCGNNNYCPNAEVTRDQMAVFLARAFGL